MARNWRLATPEQQALLTAEFRTLLVRTIPARCAIPRRGRRIQATARRAAHYRGDGQIGAMQPGNEPMTLNHEMEKTPAGWKIFDVDVAGVRLVTTYREVFAEKVRAGGVSGLIEFLADGNREGGSRFSAVKASFWEKSRLMFAILQNMFQGGRQ